MDRLTPEALAQMNDNDIIRLINKCNRIYIEAIRALSGMRTWEPEFSQANAYYKAAGKVYQRLVDEAVDRGCVILH